MKVVSMIKSISASFNHINQKMFLRILLLHFLFFLKKKLVTMSSNDRVGVASDL